MSNALAITRHQQSSICQADSRPNLRTIESDGVGTFNIAGGAPAWAGKLFRAALVSERPLRCLC